MSDVIQKISGKFLLLAGCFLMFAGISTANAQENILGDWEFTMDMGDMGGMGGGMNITINSTFTKGDDGTITGTWDMVFDMPEGEFGGGMGGPGGADFQMPTFKIVDVKIDGQNLSFTRKAEGDAGGGMGGMMIEDRQFAGTIKGDTIELTSSSNFGEMTYKGTRKAASQVLEGDWEFKMSMGDMGMEFTINSTVTKDAQGKYSMTWDQQMTPPEGMEGMGPGGDGFPSPEIKIEDIKLEGNKLTFVQKVNFGDMGGMGPGGGMVFNFAGTIEGDKIEGSLSGEDNGMGMGPMELILTGQRKGAAAAKTATGLEGDWTFVTTFGDMGMELRADVIFKKAADGTYSGTWIALPMEDMGGMVMGDMPQPKVTISDIKLDGDKVTFIQNVDLTEMGMGGEIVSNYTGTLKGDKIEGVMSSDRGESTSIGTRKKAAGAEGDGAIVGDWEFKMEMPDMGMGTGPMEMTINSTITKAEDGTYSGTWERQMPEGGMRGGPGGGGPGGMGDFQRPTVTIEDIKLDGNKLTFVQKFKMPEGGGMGGMGMGMGDMSSNFTGTLENGKITGILSNEMMGDRTLTGTRK